AFLTYPLTRLRMKAYIISYSASEYHEFARSLPNLELLDLSFPHCPSTLSLDLLLPFAEYCPKLFHFGANLDTSSSQSLVFPIESTPFLVLREFNILTSPLDAADVESVATFFAQLLPSSCALLVNKTEEEKTKGWENWVSVKHSLSSSRESVPSKFSSSVRATTFSDPPFLLANNAVAVQE
ncbi:hypothetical protein H0H93_004328, partial [Arthromyces matolae]